MKTVFRIILIFVLAFNSIKASAAIITDTDAKSIISRQVIENYKKYTDAEIHVDVVGLPFKDFVAPNGKVTFIVKPSVDKFMARDLEKVSVCVNGNVVKVFNAPIVVKAYQNVLVASKYITRETEINSSVVRVEKKEISNNFEYPLRAEDIDKQMMSRKVFVEGEIIDRRFVKARPEILRNGNVTVFFNTNNLTVSVEGTALSDGAHGDNICVLSKQYNKIYKGTVVGENRVLVKI